MPEIGNESSSSANGNEWKWSRRWWGSWKCSHKVKPFIGCCHWKKKIDEKWVKNMQKWICSAFMAPSHEWDLLFSFFIRQFHLFRFLSKIFFSFKFQRSVLTNGCECGDEEHESAAFRRQKLRKNQFKGCTKGLDRFSLSKMGL